MTTRRISAHTPPGTPQKIRPPETPSLSLAPSRQVSHLSRGPSRQVSFQKELEQNLAIVARTSRGPSRQVSWDPDLVGTIVCIDRGAEEHTVQKAFRRTSVAIVAELSEAKRRARRVSSLGLHRNGARALKPHEFSRKLMSEASSDCDVNEEATDLEPEINAVVSTPKVPIVSKPDVEEPVSHRTPLIRKCTSRLSVRPMADVIKQACDVLPNQAVLENFVHRNPWEGCQSMDFHEAHVHMRNIQSYMSPGERLAQFLHTDPRTRVNAALSELCAVFLDLGVAKWEAPDRDKGFLYFFATLEVLGCSPWRNHARLAARKLLKESPASSHPSRNLAEMTLQENLRCFRIPPKEFVPATRSMLLDLPGWAGMFKRMDAAPDEAPSDAVVRLCDFCAVQSILLRSSMEALARQAGWGASTPLGTLLTMTNTKCEHPKEYEGEEEDSLQNPSGLAFLDQNADQREKLEEEFEVTTLGAIGDKTPKADSLGTRPILQVYTCIDEREESLRRHIEEATDDPSEIETFGVAGFFGLPIKYKGQFQHEEIILAPAGNNPPHILSEYVPAEEQTTLIKYNRRRRLLARMGISWENASFSPLRSLLLAAIFPVSLLRLIFMCFFPNTTRVVMRVFYANFMKEPLTDFANPFTPEEAAKSLAATFNNIGQTTGRFAPIVIVLGHGSRTVSNPFDAAHNCGACGGREGGPNARLMARCANDPEVRKILAETYHISIPDDTWYMGGYHDTTSDLVEIFDLNMLPESHVGHYHAAVRIINDARGKNALERCDKFCHAKNVRTPAQALRHVATRSTDLGEARPECGHATNAAVIIGRRPLTKGRDFARRLFLPSYDPFNDDEMGTHLERVLTPALIVCSGISLEYFFSTVDGGAGTKVPANIVGNFGVMQGTSGDLLIGLPTQMTELHSPVRALFLVDAPVATVKAVLSRNKALHDLVHNEWVRFFVRDPHTKQFYYQLCGEYMRVEYEEGEQPYVPFDQQRGYAHQVYRYESQFTFLSFLIMALSAVLPVYRHGVEVLPTRVLAAIVFGTSFAFSTLAFSRRYLHGEFTYDRIVLLLAGMLVGFNIIAIATDLKHVLVGWNLLGFCSVYLIGIYNDRPTAGANSTLVFFVYQLSDAAMLVAAAFENYQVADTINRGGSNIVAVVGLLVAALIKSSQFPFTDLLARSMEGPMPSSALGYAALSSHVGIVVLANMKPLWFGYVWARIVLALFGFFTAIVASLIAGILSDRKGAIAHATAATIGLILIVLSAGYENIALVLALGNASMRMIQVLRSANLILDHHNLKCALGDEPRARLVWRWVFHLCWTLKRVNSDAQVPRALHYLTRRFCGARSFGLGKFQQWVVTSILLVFSGIPFTPLEEYKEKKLTEIMHQQPCEAAAWIMLSIIGSTALTWCIFFNVLTPDRFLHRGHDSKRHGAESFKWDESDDEKSDKIVGA